MSVYTIMTNGNVSKITNLMEEITELTTKVNSYIGERSHEEADIRQGKLIDIANGLQEMQMALCGVLAQEMNEVITKEVCNG